MLADRHASWCFERASVVIPTERRVGDVITDERPALILSKLNAESWVLIAELPQPERVPIRRHIPIVFR